MKPTLLFIDDDPRAGELMLRFCAEAPYGCRAFQDPAAALAWFREHGADIVVTDLKMPGLSGLELLEVLRREAPEVPVIMVTGYASVDSAMEAMKRGATDFIKKPYDMEELGLLVEKTLERARLRRENMLLRRQLSDERARFGMIGRGQAMQKVFHTIGKIADIRCHVIIQGESGTGKELAARAIHTSGSGAERPFVVIDCGSLTDTLLESELFGHEKGAFTGAVGAKQGLLEAASGGTVFLDEICNISDAMQTKLMRVVQEQQVTRVGGVRPTAIDVRFIAATNRNLDQMVREGRFRHDLYHRLNVVTINLPPLREHPEDIPLLVRHFIDHFNAQYHRQVQGFDADSMQRLLGYGWPGNVRELRNLVERHIALADGPVLTLEGLAGSEATGAIDYDLPTLETLERRYLLKVLDHFDGNREKTARALGINKSTLWRKLQHYESGGG